jgi:membrane associated rhomboid family serine protease
MNTSGGGTLNASLYCLAVVMALQVAHLLNGGGRPRLVPGAVAVWGCVAVPSLLQIPFPGLELALRRDPELIRHHAQIWRLLTSVVVQDGGVVSTVINLALLAITLLFTGPLWGSARLILVFMLSQLTFDVLMTFLSSDLGAGNSGATFGSATSVLGLAVLYGVLSPAVRVRAVVVLVDGVILLASNDGHGTTVLAGILIGALVAGAGPGRQVWQNRFHDVSA